jgi:acyl-CoA synthetase (AMP-forming)/AMP-acid ligase II
MNIAALLASAGAPDKPALVFAGRPDQSVTFRQLDELSTRLAGGLYNRGLRALDRVLVLAPLSINLFASLIAIFKLGAAAVFLDPQSELRQLERAAALAGAKAALCTSGAAWLRWISPALGRVPISLVVDGRGPRSVQVLAQTASVRTGIVGVQPEDPALITFTGGSTDPAGARGVLRTHRLLIAQHKALGHAFPTTDNDVDLPAFPIVTLHNLASGVTSIMPRFSPRHPERLRPETIIAQMQKYSVTTASGSPAYWRLITEYCTAHKVMLALRRILTGGAPVQPGLMESLAEIAPGAEVFSVYGSSEAEPVALMPAGRELRHLAAISAQGGGIPLGRPVADVEVRVLDGSGRPLPAGQVGEFWVSGDHVARTYFVSAQAHLENKRIDTEGRSWHGMGDLGYSDAGGRLWLVGRINTVILRQDQAIYPGPIETVIETLPFIRRAALVGRPDARLNERVTLVVELAKGPALPGDWEFQVRLMCSTRGWPVDELRAVDRIPLDARHHARIDYARLRSSIPAIP